jgi:hypothetical protein
MPKLAGMRRIVETHKHSRESRTNRTTLSFGIIECIDMKRRHAQPHIGHETVLRTGTLPPPSCGKGPKAVRESVVVLPGSPRNLAGRLTGKGSDRESWKTAAIVVVGITPHQGGRESRPQGQRRQVREAFDFAHVKASYD